MGNTLTLLNHKSTRSGISLPLCALALAPSACSLPSLLSVITVMSLCKKGLPKSPGEQKKTHPDWCRMLGLGANAAACCARRSTRRSSTPS